MRLAVDRNIMPTQIKAWCEMRNQKEQNGGKFKDNMWSWRNDCDFNHGIKFHVFRLCLFDPDPLANNGHIWTNSGGTPELVQCKRLAGHERERTLSANKRKASQKKFSGRTNVDCLWPMRCCDSDWRNCQYSITGASLPIPLMCRWFGQHHQATLLNLVSGSILPKLAKRNKQFSKRMKLWIKKSKKAVEVQGKLLRRL